MKLNLAVTVVMIILATGFTAACGGGHSATAQPAALESVTSFDDFPLLWLGASYDSDGDGVGDMPLTHARPKRSDAFYGPHGELIRPAITGFSMSYGQCEIPPGQDSCNIPVSLSFYPTNGAPVLAEQVKTGGALQVRGIDATIYGDGQLWVETSDVTFSISTQASSTEERLRLAIRIADQLEGANAKAKGRTKGSPFTAKGAATGGTAPPGEPASPTQSAAP